MEKPQEFQSETPIVHLDGLCVSNEGTRRLALKSNLVIQEASLHQVEELRVLHAHVQ